MKEIINDNYNSIVARCLIMPDTNMHEFIVKLYEEVDEVKSECIIIDPEKQCDIGKNIEDIDMEKLSFEIADVVLTAFNFAKHYDIDIERILKEKIEINFKRAKDAQS